MAKKRIKHSLFTVALSLVVLPLLCLTSCGSSQKVYPDPHEAEYAARATLYWMQERYGISSDPELERLFELVSAQLGGTLEKKRRWNIVLCDAPTANAYSLGAGYIVLTKRLLGKINNEAQLAAVIAHEMAHEVLGHTKEVTTTVNQPRHHHDIYQELEADETSTTMLYLAGYDPRAAIHTVAQSDNAHIAMQRIHAMEANLFRYPNATEHLGNSRVFKKVWRKRAKL